MAGVRVARRCRDEPVRDAVFGGFGDEAGAAVVGRVVEQDPLNLLLHGVVVLAERPWTAECGALAPATVRCGGRSVSKFAWRVVEPAEDLTGVEPSDGRDGVGRGSVVAAGPAPRGPGAGSVAFHGPGQGCGWVAEVGAVPSPSVLRSAALGGWVEDVDEVDILRAGRCGRSIVPGIGGSPGCRVVELDDASGAREFE